MFGTTVGKETEGGFQKFEVLTSIRVNIGEDEPRMIFPLNTVAKYTLNKYDYVELYFNVQTSQIGIHFTETPPEYAGEKFKICQDKNTSQVLWVENGIRSFLRYWGIGKEMLMQIKGDPPELLEDVSDLIDLPFWFDEQIGLFIADLEKSDYLKNY